MGAGVVGVAVGDRRREEDLGLEFSQHRDQGVFLRFTVAQGPVATIEIAQDRDPQGSSGCFSFAPAFFRGAAGAAFAAGEMEHAHAMPLLYEACHRASAGEFDIVGVGADGQTIELHAAFSCAAFCGQLPGTRRRTRKIRGSSCIWEAMSSANCGP